MANSQTRDSENPFYYVDDVPIARIFLSLDNPRHEEVLSEAEAIERLCAREEVLPLARDIVRHGLSPLERFAMVAVPGSQADRPSYNVAEGNRRICALKLLADPDRAPPKLRRNFESLSAEWAPISAVPGVIFNDRDTLRIWLDRVHSGPQGGIGRRTWDAEQKQRFSGSAKNRLAQSILDYAETMQMITKTERRGKLTTAQRFLNPEVFQESLGIDRSNPEEVYRTRPKDEFDIILKKFIRDLVEGEKVNSRKNRPEIIQYSRMLPQLPGVTGRRIEPEPLEREETGAAPKPRPRRKPRKPQKVRHVKFENSISEALQKLGNTKLESLYYSICSFELEIHTPIVCVGAWAFFETLTACQGRNDSTSFDAFLSKNKLISLGIQGDTVSLRSALGRMKEYGNSTKHHPTSATFNGDQLNNDMTTLREVILKCIEEAAANP